MERKTNMDGYQKEKLMALKAKEIIKPKRDMASYLQNVAQLQAKFEDANPEGITEQDMKDMDPNERQMIQSRKAYYRELKKVLEASDVVLQVLDARDPEGCRNHEVE
jgi:nuclear GTP-binding protein